MNAMVVDTLKKIKHESDCVFFNPKTKERIKDVKTALKAACRRAEIEYSRFHDLRHTAATHMLTRGVDFATIAEILGHADIRMIMRYAHPPPENRRKAVDILAGVISDKYRKVGTIWAQSEFKICVTDSFQYN